MIKVRYTSPNSVHEITLLLARLGAIAAIACPLAACSFALPSLMPQPAETTGSVKSPERRLFRDLGDEDWRRAKGALAVALDLQGNGRPVKWDNPDTKAGGAVAPLGGPFVLSNDICRRYRATLTRPDGEPRSTEGKACRVESDEWEIRADEGRVPGR
jgi:surface antigen